MKEIAADPSLVAYCGLYCGACRSLLKGRCPGCAANQKASWCKVRSCCIANNYGSCADCAQVADIMACGTFNNFVSKLFAIFLRSNRPACIRYIKRQGREAFAREMAGQKTMTIKR